MMESSANGPDPAVLENADIESSSDAYAQRFAGSSGQWMLAVQENLTRRLLRHYAPGATVLDVGGGHGQLALPLSQAGFTITVLGSDPVCAYRIQDAIDAGQCRFATGNVIDLPFAPKSFDIAMSFRMLTHCGQWPKLVEELCRVARHDVVVDYPSSQSVNCIAPWLFEAKKKYETSTRLWRSFRHEEVVREFERNGFRLAGMRKQFFLPMVIHRMLKCRPASVAAEAVCRATGLTRFGGSPVIARFQRNPDGVPVPGSGSTET